MKFFIPFAEDDIQSERVILATSEFTGFAIPYPRIYSLEYRYNRKIMKATVGEKPDFYYCAIGIVICILENSDLFAVCTPDRGVVKSEPILIPRNALISIARFDQT